MYFIFLVLLPEEQCALNKPVNTFYSQEEIFSLKHGKVIKQLKGIHSLDISCKCHSNQLSTPHIN